jgi:hypothetical protein
MLLAETGMAVLLVVVCTPVFSEALLNFNLDCSLTSYGWDRATKAPNALGYWMAFRQWLESFNILVEWMR